MKYWFFWWVWFFSAVSYSCEVIDDEGNQIHLRQPAQRIISLAPDLTENVFALGVGEQIVGVMQGSDYPAKAKFLPVVASYQSLDLEKIIKLHPDLILVWGEGKLVQSLRKLNVPIYISHPRRLLDVPKTMARLGCLTGTDKKAKQLVNDYLQHYQILEKKYADKRKITVFYQVWQNPLITISTASWINDVITLCGGVNIFSQLKGAAPEINLESVIMANPDVILGTQSQPRWQESWKKWPQLKAVKTQNLFDVDANLIERASPRLLQGMDIVCRNLEKARMVL